MNRIDAIYARQSIDKPDSISIESQIEYCKYETRGSDYEVYSDKGYSGKNTERPQFLRMLSAVRSGQIKRVICYKLDRCSRSILDFTKLMDEFQRHGVEFISCTEKFDTSSPMGRAMLNICVIFAQLERETIQQRIYDAYHSRSKKGFFMGGRIPLGFQLEPYILDGKKTARYQQVDSEAQILKLMYAVYEKPFSSLGDVVIALQEAGIRNPKREDGLWFRSHIGRILKNPIYVKADSDVYSYFANSNVTIESDPNDFVGTNGCYLYSNNGVSVLVLAPHEGIVSSDVWLRCAAKNKQTRNKTAPGKVRHTWLAGIIKCAKCGYALVVRQRRSKTGHNYRYLVCSHSGNANRSCVGIHGLDLNRIESIVSHEIISQAKTVQFDTPESIPDEKKMLKNRITQAETEISRLIERSAQAGDVSMHFINEHIELLHSRIEAWKMKIDESGVTTESACEYMQEWDTYSFSAKRMLANAFIEYITVSENEIVINWKL